MAEILISHNDTADIAQLLLGALVALMLHQPGEHCGYPRFWIVQEHVPIRGPELLPITGQKCE